MNQTSPKSNDIISNIKSTLRFRVYNLNGEVFFNGTLNDTTELNPLDHVLENGNTCDFSELIFGSWIGFLHFSDWLKQRNFYVKVTNIRADLFEMIRLIPELMDRLEITSGLYYTFNTTKMLDVTYLHTSELETRYSAHGDFGLNQGEYLVAPRPLALQVYFGQDSEIDPTSRWGQKNKETYNFWIKSTYFMQQTIDLFPLQVTAIKGNLLSLISELLNKVSAAEDASHFIIPNIKFAASNQIELASKQILEIFTGVVESLEAFKKDTKKAAFQIICQSRSHIEFMSAIQNFMQHIIDLTEPGKLLEVIGPQIGNHIGTMNFTETFINFFSDCKTPNEESIEKIRDTFHILDPLSEGDWEATLEEIVQELQQIDQIVQQCVITLQMFDLQKQMIDHRLKEAHWFQTNIDQLCQQDRPVKEAAQELIDLFLKHLVTDQETQALAFFLPETNVEDSPDRADPGDVMLF